MVEIYIRILRLLGNQVSIDNNTIYLILSLLDNADKYQSRIFSLLIAYLRSGNEELLTIVKVYTLLLIVHFN